MKKARYLLVLCIFAVMSVQAQLPMGQWKMHNAFTQVTQIVQGKNLVYCVTEGTLFSVDKQDLELGYYSKVTGLTGTGIVQIAYSEEISRLIVFYSNGKIDLLNEDGDVESIFDLYISETNYNKSPNSITLNGAYAYLATDFGVVVINLKKREIADTYSVVMQEDVQPILSVALTQDSIFAATADNLFSARRNTNLLDYNVWEKKADVPNSGKISKIATNENLLYLLSDNKLYTFRSGWQLCSDTLKVNGFDVEDGRLFVYSDLLTYILDDNGLEPLPIPNAAATITYDSYHKIYWGALYGYGVGKFSEKDKTLSYIYPSGPCSNSPYRIRCMEDATYIVPGGYFTSGTGTAGQLMIYKDGGWFNYNSGFFAEQLGGLVLRNFDDVAVEPNHPEHFFISSFGNCLLEFKDDKLVKWHTPENSALECNETNKPLNTTWVDGLCFDSKGNLFMINNSVASVAGVKILDPKGNWHTISNKATSNLNRSKDLLISSLNENIKITMSIRSNTGIGVYDDNGTPYDEQDDRSVYHQLFVDQDGKELRPEYIYSINQDKEGVLWICTNAGLILVDNPATLLESNRCRRIIISRNDGTTLADYLLNDERINCVAFDGTNRRWIGTANSGLYLLKETEDSGMEVYHHFTADNSPLPSDNIIALNISPRTGEVMIGTAEGFITYQSDAADSADDYSDVYAYPNPVRPDYEGEIAIMGLIDGSFVKITDAAGNLVCQTTSRGSIAVWDGKDMNGSHVRSGVYLAQIVSADGKKHTLTKILVMH